MANDTSTTPETATSLRVLNTLSAEAFTARLADIFEHSPWVAQRVADLRPFGSVDALQQAMVLAMNQATPAEQLALLRAHPELAGKEAQHGALTAASDHEQAKAGLKALSADEMRHITALNVAYRAQHGFPFIVCVGHHTKQSLFRDFERRAGNPTDIEMREALNQVAAIAGLRLNAMLAA